MSSNISKLVKLERVNLSVVKKLELIRNIEKGATVKNVCEKYVKVGNRKHMKTGKEESLD